MSTKPLNTTSAAALGLLHDGPMTGGRLVAAFNKQVGHFFNVTRSQIYRELPDLLDVGYVKEGKPGPRSSRPYWITPAGRRAFRRWLTEEDLVPGREALRSSLALRVAFAGTMSAQQRQRVVDAAVEHHTEQLAVVREQAKIARKNGEEWLGAAIDFAVAYHKGVLAWLKALPQP